MPDFRSRSGARDWHCNAGLWMPRVPVIDAVPHAGIVVCMRWFHGQFSLTLAGFLALWLAGVSRAATPDVFRFWFTPTVVPTNFAGNVRFEAEITGSPASVTFRYNSVDRFMFDNGSNGDLVAGDGVWTCLFTANEIISKYTTSTVFRPFIGFCVPTNAGQFNIFAEIWTPEIGLATIRTNLAATNQETGYVVNYVASKSQLTNFSATYWASNFFKLHADNYDFLNFVHIAGVRGNRYHAGAKNSVQGIGSILYTNDASFGSGGRLQGYSVFPISSLFDGAGPAFSHETGHQWINYLSATIYSNGISHWPKGDIAINVMGFSIPGGGNVGGNFTYTFTTNGSGGYVTGPAVGTNISTFNAMELYLMGFVSSNQVPTYFVFTNQNVTPVNGQVFTSNEVSLVTISNVIAAQGLRFPTDTNSQRIFRCATIILSEQLLDANAMSLYDFFARRIEGKQPVAYVDGFASGTSNPWFLATGGRSVIYSKIADETPVLAISQLSNHDFRINFTGKPGIRYQPQRSVTFANWSNVASLITIPVSNPPVDVATNFTLMPLAGTNSAFYRVNVLY